MRNGAFPVWRPTGPGVTVGVEVTRMNRWTRFGAVGALLVASACGGAGDAEPSEESPVEDAGAILYVESDWPLGPFETLPPLRAVTAEGDAVQVPPASQGAWSPDGTQLAFFDPESHALSLVADDGEEHTLFEAPRGGMLVFGPSWSPAGDRLAAILSDGGSRLQLMIVDVRTGSAAIHPLPRGVGGYADIPLFFQWAPDGEEVLVAWGPVVSVDADTGELVVVSDKTAVAAWGPDGSVYHATVTLDGTSGPLSRWTREAGSTPVASPPELERAGLDHIFGIVATIPGERLIIVSPSASGSTLTLRAFDLVAGSPLDVETPAATATIDDPLVVFEASPDGADVALITAVGREEDTEGGVTPLDVELRVIEMATGRTRSVTGWETWSESPWMGTQPMDVLRLVKSLSWGV